MQEPTQIYKDPESPEEQAAADSLRRKIAGFPDVIVQHNVVKPPIVHEIDEAAHRVIQFPSRNEEKRDESQVA